MKFLQNISRSIGHKITRKEVTDLKQKIAMLDRDEASELFRSIANTEKIDKQLGTTYGGLFQLLVLRATRNELTEERRKSVAMLLNPFLNAQSECAETIDRWGLYFWRVVALTMLADSLYTDGLSLWESIERKAHELKIEDLSPERPIYFQ